MVDLKFLSSKFIEDMAVSGKNAVCLFANIRATALLKI